MTQNFYYLSLIIPQKDQIAQEIATSPETPSTQLIPAAQQDHLLVPGHHFAPTHA